MLHFLYGLSPGLDIRFSDEAELQAIRVRLQQMREIGVHHFALLFDDLPGNLTDEDRQRFSSVASAQSSVTNAIYNWLQSQDVRSRLLFCPTPYCDRMVSWKLGGEKYLDTIGEELDPRVEVLWTGPEIISQDISIASLKELARRIRRQPIIWDNLHANDYDLRRIYTGPYNRNPQMRSAVRGILSNPNNEYPLNYIPLRTLGEYLHDPNYEPRTAFLRAAEDWSARYETIRGTVSSDDVKLLAECYYLPYEEGVEAERLKQLTHCLLTQPTDTWGDAYEQLSRYYQRIRHINEQLTELHDRELFYAWSRRIWELREELELIHDFVLHKQEGRPFQSETHLPFTCRGGMVANLQRRLLMGADGSFDPV